MISEGAVLFGNRSQRAQFCLETDHRGHSSVWKPITEGTVLFGKSDDLMVSIIFCEDWSVLTVDSENDLVDCV